MTPSTISFPPSGHWDGNQGSWSTFALQIGIAPGQQDVRVLPSTSGNCIWVVLPEGCTPTDPKDCSSSRGSTFRIANSSTWEDKGLYTLPLNPLHDLPYSGNADFGFDNVTLNWEGRGGVPLNHQTIAGIATKDFYLGYVGLAITSLNISSFNDGYPSLLGTLRSQNRIQSSTYGYTAGASYLSYPLNNQASLTLGGYDSTRLDVAQNVTSSGADVYRPMVLGLSAIEARSDNTATSLLSSPIIIALDSTIGELWLPISACTAIETTFSLSYNSTLNLYTLPADTRTKNLAQNPSIVFTLTSGSPSSPNAINITLPYLAFDQMLTVPNSFGDVSGPYFPLRRAVNASQYMLGRTFLQAAYLIADYDRGTFSVFPAVFPDASLEENVVPILRPSKSTSKRGIHALSTADIVVIFCFVALAALLLIATVIHRWHRSKRRQKAERRSTLEKGEVGNSGKTENGTKIHEMDEAQIHEMNETQVHEIVDTQIHEINDTQIHEMNDSSSNARVNGVEIGAGRERYEMPGREGDDGAVEVECKEWSGKARAELDGREVPRRVQGTF